MRLEIRVSIEGEFLNSHTHHVDDELTHSEIMDEAFDFVEGLYGDYPEWDEGEVSWTVEY